MKDKIRKVAGKWFAQTEKEITEEDLQEAIAYLYYEDIESECVSPIAPLLTRLALDGLAAQFGYKIEHLSTDADDIVLTKLKNSDSK